MLLDAQVIYQLHQVHAGAGVKQAVHQQYRVLVALMELGERLELLPPALPRWRLVLVRRHQRNHERIRGQAEHLPGRGPLVGGVWPEHLRIHRVRHVDRLQPGLAQFPLAVAGHRDRLRPGHLEELQVRRRHRMRLNRRP